MNTDCVRHQCGTCGAPLLGPRPLLDREAVRRALVGSDYNPDAALPDAHWVHAQQVRGLADAVMELARPMPTREQVASYLRETVQTLDKGEEWHLADGVLALLTGGET